MILSSTILALFAATPLANAQRFRPSRTGCLLDQSAQIIADIKCGKKSAVAFAVEWYGADAQELQAWLGAAGCSEQEASDEAQWAVERCRVQPRAQARPDQYQERRVLAWKDSGRRVAGKRNGQHDRRASIVAENESLAGRDGDEDDSTSSASTTISSPTTTLASTTSPTNTWTLVLTTNDATTTKTCATTSSFTTTVCSTNTNKHTRSCTTAPTETMACLSGFDCAFTDTGAFTCYEKTGVRVYGRLIAAVLGLAALFAAAAIVFRFCRHRKQQGKAKMLRGGDAGVEAVGRGEKESFGVGVAHVGASPPPTPASIGDTVPLMQHGGFDEAAVPGDAYPGKRPVYVVQQCGGRLGVAVP